MEEKNPAAVALGRLGGSAPTKKKKGLAALPKARREAIAAAGVKARQKNAAKRANASKKKGR